jgi:hypothetical protein
VSDPVRFIGRTKETKRLIGFYKQRKHVLLIGALGIGKTVLIQHVRESCPFFLCRDSSSLGRICDGIEKQLGWPRTERNVTQRKNFCFDITAHSELVVFDHVAHARPRVSRFIAALTESVPVWIVCRSDSRNEIGHVWEHLYKFARIEARPFMPSETRNMINGAIANGSVGVDAREHAQELHRLSGGNPRVLQQLLIELGARTYKMNRLSGRKLLALDRQIHLLQLSRKAGLVAP